MKSTKKWLAVAVCALPLAGLADSNTNVVWKRSVGLGATYKSGNTDKTLYTINLKGDRFSPEADMISSLYGEYGKTEGDLTEGKVRGQAEYRRKFSPESKWYASVNSEAIHDVLKGIRVRAKVGPNIGYYFINNATMKLDVSCGVNYGYERNGSDDPTVENEYDFGEYRVAGNFLWNISETANYYLNLEYSANVEDTDDGNGLLVTGVKSKINTQLALYAELRDEYDNIPTTGTEYNDVTVIAGLSYDF